MVISLEQLAHDFTSLFTERVFRLETLDYYEAPNEREPYARFLAGRPVDPAWRKPWASLVRSVRDSGRQMARVHIVSEPVTEYVRFSLLHGYPANVAAGEDVRILGRSQATGLPEWDFWLFDDDVEAVLFYDDAGHVDDVELSGYGLEPLCRARDEALRRAVPLAQYVAENNISDERMAG